MTDLVTPSKSLGYSNIFLDFLADVGSARHFFLAPGVVKVAHAVDNLSYDRATMAAILENQNKTFAAPQKVFDQIDRLTDPRAVCVFSGQQACLFGGPLLILFKALGVVKAAATLEETLQRPVIPMFWIAGDDHDFDEVNHTWLLDRQTEPVRIGYDAPPSIELPISEVSLSNAEELNRAREAVHQALGETDFTPDVYRLLDESYCNDDTLVTAFGKMMSSLAGKYGLVMFSPGDTEVKRHAIPFFKSIVAKQQDLRETLDQTNKEIVQNGYHIQVEKSDAATHLFYNLHGRKPVLHDGDGFTVGETKLTEEELLAAIETQPEKFSPDVITRPVFQSYLFPVVAQKGGPAEVAYLAQVNPVFGVLGAVPPCHSARPTASLLETRFEKIMSDYHIGFEDLTGDIEQVINRVLAASFPSELEDKFKSLRKDILEHFNEFTADALEFDSSLESFSKQTFGKIDYALGNFEGKVFASHKKQSKAVRNRIYRLHNALFTNRGLQERSLNLLYFLAKYGLDLIDFVHDRLDVQETSHQVIHLSELDQ